MLTLFGVKSSRAGALTADETRGTEYRRDQRLAVRVAYVIPYFETWGGPAYSVRELAARVVAEGRFPVALCPSSRHLLRWRCLGAGPAFLACFYDAAGRTQLAGLQCSDSVRRNGARNLQNAGNHLADEVRKDMLPEDGNGAL